MIKKKIISIILIGMIMFIIPIVLLAQTKGELLFKERFDVLVIGSMGWELDGILFRVYDSLGTSEDGRDICGTAFGAFNIQKQLSIAYNKQCTGLKMEHFEKIYVHEFCHLYDNENNLSHNVKLPKRGANRYEDFAIWCEEFIREPDHSMIFNPKVHKYFNSLKK